MPQLHLQLHPENDKKMTPWVALRVVRHLLNDVRDELGMAPLSEAAIRVVLRQVLHQAQQDAQEGRAE